MITVVLVVAAVVAVGAYLTWLAGRLDRLAVRVEAARASLDAQLVRRAVAAAVLEPEGGGELALAAQHALALADDPAAPPGGREAVESALTRALRAALPAAGEEPSPVEETALTAAARVRLARQFHNDAVRACRQLRGRRLVRWLRVYGRARAPAYFDIDDGA